MQDWFATASGVLALTALLPIASLAIVPAKKEKVPFDLDLALLGHSPYRHTEFFHLDIPWNLSIEFQFLHVGKTGGTSLERDFEHTINLSRAEMLPHTKSRAITANCATRHRQHKYVFFVRAPISRYVSGWISRFRYGSPRYPDIPNWSPAERFAYTTFNSPNALGCSLGSPNATVRRAAQQAIRGIEHTRWDINWYWHSLANLQACIDQVFFVGRLEHHSDDIDELVERLQQEGAMLDVDFKKAKIKATTSEYDHLKELGPCAIRNLRRWYRKDYEIVDYLVSAGKLPSSYSAEVRRRDGLMKEESA